MEKSIIVVLCVVCFLGLVALVSGFTAEALRIKPHQVRYQEVLPVGTYVCIYPRSPAFALGITAALSAMTAQMIITVASKCNFCRIKGPRGSNPYCSYAVACFVISRCGCVVSLLLFLGGVIGNYGYSRRHVGRNISCPVVRPGLFAAATSVSFFGCILGIIYYLIMTSQIKPVPSIHQDDDVAVGQPQFPPPKNIDEDPVWVQNDTYGKQQPV